MPFVFACVCGKKLRAKEENVGRVFTCPACKVNIEVPSPGTLDLGIDLSGDPNLEPNNEVESSPDAPDFNAPPPISISPEPLSRSDYLASRRRYVSPIDKPPLDVAIVDINVPFWSLVNFIVKSSLASLVASIFLFITVVIPFMFVYSYFVGFRR